MTARKSSHETSPDAVRSERDRILASKIFSRSKRQSDFLDYVVDAALEGRQDQLKEFTLGIDVFERDDSFDPSIDSIVRVEASRLRSKLREYYDDEGRTDAVRIDIPKGHYVPVFSRIDRDEADSRSSLKPYLWMLAVAAVLLTSVLYVSLRTPNMLTASVTPPLVPMAYSIAVLPLRDWSATQEEYFSEAMTDALISSLAEIRELRVTSLTSVMRFSDTDMPMPDIARSLDVAYLVEGSVMRDDNMVRITAQLIAAGSDTHLWSKTFDRPAENLMAVQKEVADEIAAQISSELIPAANGRAKQRNPAAYEAYMKGRYFYNQFTADGYRRSLLYFQEAIDIEPDFAEAYAGLASCHCLLAGHGLELEPPDAALPESRSLAMRALRLDPNLAEPIAFLGIIDFKYGWDLASAELKLTRAIEINPSLPRAYIWHSQILEAQGRHADAVERARFAKRIDPLSMAASMNLGWQLYQAGRHVEANAEIDRLIAFNESFWGGHWVKGHLYRHREQFEDAIKEYRRAIELGGGHTLPVSALGYALGVSGSSDEARGIAAELEALSRNTYVSPFHIATVYAGLNDADRMFEWLERSYQVRARSMAWLHVTREMQPFHDDERFRSLLDRVGVYRQANAAHVAKLVDRNPSENSGRRLPRP